MKIKDLILKTEKLNWLDLKDLQPNNLKTPYHTNLVKESLIKNGFSMTIFVWQDPKTNEIYICDGHTRRDVLVELKSEGFDIPDQLSCTFLDIPNRKTAIKYLLEVFNTKKNPIDETVLAWWIPDEGIDLEEVNLGWLDLDTPNLEDTTGETLQASEDNFELPAINKIKTDIVQGDIFEFRKNGEVLHMLGCGSSTDLDFVNKVKGTLDIDGVLTDPPYGVDITKEGKGSSINNGRYPEIANDKDTNIAKEFYQTCQALELKNLIIWGGNYFTDFLPVTRCWVVWDKCTPPELTFAQGEMAWTSFDKNLKIYKKAWMGNLVGKVNLDVEVLEKEIVNKSSRTNRSHPTQKSIELHGWILNDFFKDNKVIFDGFGGSGTTLLACHQVAKKTVIIEFIPEYCQVIIDRIQKLDSSVKIIKISNN